MFIKLKFLTTPQAVILAGLFMALFILVPSKNASAAYDSARLIDNDIFLNSTSLPIPSIQAFLESKGSGLATRSFLLNCYGPDSKERQWYTAAGAPCDQTIPASQIIYYAAQIYGINPQVILATLQKEQSLISSPNPTDWQISQAMGYGCPTTGDCNSASNFFYQIDSGVWVLRYHYERARGNNTWWNTNANWVCGTEKNFYKPNLYPGQNVRFYDEYNINYRTVPIANAATSALYCYTPHVFNNHTNSPDPNQVSGSSRCWSSHPTEGSIGKCYTGSYNFVYWFERWFGSTISGKCIDGFAEVKTDVVFRKFDSKIDLADFLVYSGSGSGCIESHIWNTGFTSWKTHIASNQPGVKFADLQVMFGDLDGGGRDYPLLFGLQNTSTNKIEAHVWNKNMKSFLAHAASNQPVVNRADSQVLVADLNGDGKDEPILIVYRNTGSGMIELHGWGGGMQSWLYNIATNVPAIDPANASLAFGDLDGDGDDEAILIAYANTGSGRIEFHVWNPGLWSWQSHIASNMPMVNPIDNKVVFADVDGNNIDEAVLVGLRSTGSGRIEFHVWNPGFTSWKSNTASNQPY